MLEGIKTFVTKILRPRKLESKTELPEAVEEKGPTQQTIISVARDYFAKCKKSLESAEKDSDKEFVRKTLALRFAIHLAENYGLNCSAHLHEYGSPYGARDDEEDIYDGAMREITSLSGVWQFPARMAQGTRRSAILAKDLPAIKKLRVLHTKEYERHDSDPDKYSTIPIPMLLSDGEEETINFRTLGGGIGIRYLFDERLRELFWDSVAKKDPEDTFTKALGKYFFLSKESQETP